MTNLAAKPDTQTFEQHWQPLVAELGDELARNGEAHDRNGSFVANNFDILKQHRFFSAAIPQAYGGGGLDYADLCALIREIAGHCGSTALAFAMHSHPVAVNLFKALRGDEKAKATLSKIAANELVVCGTGANDWLKSSGVMRPVEGGFRVSARKRFVSGSPGANVFVTSSVLEGETGSEVLHFPIPLNADGIRIEDNWDTLGMRATGSNDIILDDVFVPAEAIVARRPAGKWHPMWDVILPIAMPAIVACYLGLAEAAYRHALLAAEGNASLASLVGDIHTELVNAQTAAERMVTINHNHGFTPSPGNSDLILTLKSIASRSARQVVEKSCDLVGGAGFFRAHPLERITRDIRAMHFHPLPQARQQMFSGRLALGLDPVA